MTTTAIQNRIIAVLVDDLLAAGLHIRVATNVAWTTELKPSRARAAIAKATGAE